MQLHFRIHLKTNDICLFVIAEYDISIYQRYTVQNSPIPDLLYHIFANFIDIVTSMQWHFQIRLKTSNICLFVVVGNDISISDIACAQLPTHLTLSNIISLHTIHILMSIPDETQFSGKKMMLLIF